ncbi:helix-turn-helix domain-containing protein [Mesorhizobium sp. RP14(2022)]|uniref:Helix-turn-helix domain-containing protein n=1 Tax=Mesorhizobium liriopis TaxID=2953882 RepID=A0ABT1CC02_9HYPH|nr:helix-turn-helix domain-containing protein [Mesorhizobium liriopis]MCO6052365.1 helix-turn-helix domain-containing protein [Mesorhizobium liriopis]
MHETQEHLSQRELAKRWRLSPRTLERWRFTGTGPRFLKLGGRCVYRLQEVEAFESAQLRDKAGRTETKADGQESVPTTEGSQ